LQEKEGLSTVVGIDVTQKKDTAFLKSDALKQPKLKHYTCS